MNICPSCKTQTQEDWYFCPNCGKILKEKPIKITLLKQILIYSVSFFLTPIGLVWGLKYIKSKNNKIKTVGIISIILTILAIIIMLYISKDFMDKYSNMFNNFQYPGL